MESLAKLNQVIGVTVVFVSHDPDDARYATGLIHLADGKIAADVATEVAADAAGERP